MDKDLSVLLAVFLTIGLLFGLIVGIAIGQASETPTGPNGCTMVEARCAGGL
jgi:hypothetical protein